MIITSKLRLFLLLALVLFFAGMMWSTQAEAATFTSTQSGNWSAGATWGGAAPGATDDAVIASGHTVTVTANASIYSLTINGTLTINSGIRLTVPDQVAADVTINSDGNLAGAGSFWFVRNDVDSALVNNGGTISVAEFRYSLSWTDIYAILATTYGGDLQIKNTGSIGDVTCIVSGGGDDLVVNGDLYLWHGRPAGAMGGEEWQQILDNSTAGGGNNVNITVDGDLLIGKLQGGTERHGKFIAGSGTIDIGGDVIIRTPDADLGAENKIEAGSGTWTVAGNWTNNDAFTAGSSTVTFDGTSGTIDVVSGGSSFNNVVFNDGGGSATFELGDAFDVDGTLTITGGTLDTKSGENNSINVEGNWSNSDTFTARSGTVTFDGTGTQDVWNGGSDFYTIKITNSSNTVTFTDDLTATNFTSNTGSVDMEFTADDDYTITNLTLNGLPGNRITLRSTTLGSQWNLNVLGAQSLSYVDVSDSDASGGDEVICSDQCIGLNENNENWAGLLVAIPTMTEWGMIIFMMLAGLGSIYYLRRQRTV